MRFIDTNILLYAISSPREDADKRRRALELLEEDDLALSVQVLQEFYYQATRRSRPDAITPEQAMHFIRSFEGLPIQPITPNIFRAAVEISRRSRLSYWDSAILAAAKAVGCESVYSEDMNSKQNYDGLRVINPFAGL